MRKIDYQLVEELYKKYMRKTKSGQIRTSWKDVIRDYQDITGEPEPRSKSSLKNVTNGNHERYWQEVHGSDPEISPDDIDNNTEQAKTEGTSRIEKLELLQDGTRKLMSKALLTSAEMMDTNYILKIHGFDPKKWIVKKLELGEWSVRNKHKEELYNYKINLEVIPVNEELITMEDIEAIAKNYKYHHEPIKLKRGKKNERAVEVSFADLHIGSLSFDFEDFKVKIARVKEELISIINPDKLYIVFYGDILHVDNTNKTTVKGTQLELEGSAFDMLDRSVDVVNYAITELADRETEVIWVQGNHSRLAEYGMMRIVQESWKNNDHITFDITPLRRKAFLYGKQLVGVFHGDMPKKQMFDWLPRDFKELWGKAKYIEQHGGHFHAEEVITKGAIVHRTLNTVKRTDDYEYSLGYSNVKRVFQTFVYDRELGLQQINYW